MIQPGVIAGLNTGLEAWGHPGLARDFGDLDGVLSTRVVEDDEGNGVEKFFEVGFMVTDRLSGDAARGWVDSSGRVAMTLEHSEDGEAWTLGKFRDAPSSPAAVAGGFEYWARAIFPVDSQTKAGTIGVVSTAGTGTPDNNPLTALTVAGVTQTLARFPYTMPTDAGELQIDLRALGWTGATVTATSDVDWEISIPGVVFSGYGNPSRLSWPAWYYTDPFGNPATVDGIDFSGAFLNSAGVRTALRCQLSRLQLNLI